MPLSYVSSLDAQPLTLNQLIAAPLVIRERFLEIMANQFVMERVLRYAGNAPGGAIAYRISSGLFADQPSSLVPARTEIPLATVTKGDLASRATRGHGLGVSFDYAMRDMDVTGEIARQLTVLKNTLVRDIDGGFYATLIASLTNTRVATAPWSQATATIRKDILAAKGLVNRAVAPGTTGTGPAASYLEYQADTIIFHPQTADDLFGSAEFNAMVFGQVQGSNVSELPAKIVGLTPWTSFAITPGTAIVCEAKTVGGYSDREPLNMTPLYDWPPARLYRSDGFRDTAAFIDNPLAAAQLTGI